MHVDKEKPHSCCSKDKNKQTKKQKLKRIDKLLGKVDRAIKVKKKLEKNYEVKRNKAYYVFVERHHLCVLTSILKTDKKRNLNDLCFMFLYFQ